MAEEAATAPNTGTPAATAATETPAAPAAETPLLGGENPTSETPAKPASEQPSAPVVPEKYEFKVPEGMVLDEAATKAFDPVARELGLSNEQAQKIVDLYASQMTAVHKANLDLFTKTQADWKAEIKADPAFAGEKFATAINQANETLKAFAPPADIKAINDLGFGNFPPLVRLLAKIGAARADDTAVIGKPSEQLSKEDRARAMYPSMQS